MFKHKHKFEDRSSFILHGKDGKEHPRLLKVCKKCGIAIHVPVYTKKELEVIDDE